jgi:curved DNA-binding protein CbpA
MASPILLEWPASHVGERMLMEQELQPHKDLYRVLSVDPQADPEVIRAAYRALARRQHPDVNADAAATWQMMELNAAFEVLGDPSSRAAYDESRHAAATSEPAAVRSDPPRTWAAGPVPGRPVAPVAVDPTPNGRQTGARATVPGQPGGMVLDFGRYAGWSLADLARKDPDYLEWLARTMIGRPYRTEIETLLAPMRNRPLSVPSPARGRRGFFGRLWG